MIVGGGPTGVELAGQVVEILRHTLRGEFRAIRPEDARVCLVEFQDRVLPTFPPDLSKNALRALEKLGVEVILGAEVTQVEQNRITYRREGSLHVLAARTILWAAGVAPRRWGSHWLRPPELKPIDRAASSSGQT